MQRSVFRMSQEADGTRATEKVFLDWGCDGGSGGGDDDAVFVYAYLKTSVTRQQPPFVYGEGRAGCGMLFLTATSGPLPKNPCCHVENPKPTRRATNTMM